MLKQKPSSQQLVRSLPQDGREYENIDERLCVLDGMTGAEYCYLEQLMRIEGGAPQTLLAVERPEWTDGR